MRFLLPLLLLALAGCTDQPVWQHQFLQFGTLIDVSIAGTGRQQAEAAFDAIEALFAERNRQWHAWQDSDLSHFNRALAAHPPEGVTIPPSLRRLIDDSRRYYRLSEGRFNPALGRLIAAWGFQGDPRPDAAAIERLRADPPDMGDLRIMGDRAWSEHPALQLDFGGIAKGLAVAQAGELLRQRGIDNFIVNAGGDLLASGLKPGNRAWVIAIEDPFRGGVLATVELESGGAVFTSGSYRRYTIDKDGKRRHHIIDPRSAAPSESIRSATVWHEDPVAADAAATTLMLTAPAGIPRMARRFGLREWLVVTEDGRRIASPGWRNLTGETRLAVPQPRPDVQSAGGPRHKLAE